jgi:hypothetical protein
MDHRHPYFYHLKDQEIGASKPRPEKGIVICVANDASMIAGTMYMIQQIRDYWKSSLPISIAHCSELSLDTRSQFESLQYAVLVRDMCVGASPPQKKR